MSYLTDKKISIIVVCYNDGGSVKEMHKRISTVMPEITDNWELIYVNDASPDNAWEILSQVAQHDKRLIAIKHSRNFGGQQAFTTGLQYCTGDAIILLDGDIQDPPELFPEFVKTWLKGYDIVYGERIRRKGSIVRRISYKLFYRFFKKLSYVNMPLDASDFSLIDRKIVDIMNSLPEKDRYIRGLRAWVGFKSIGIPYTRSERFAGETNWNLLGYIGWARRLLFSFSYKPLEWIAYIAGIVTVLTTLAIITYLVMAIYLPAPSGFLTLLMIILFLGAVQLLALSVIAEYLGRIFDEIKGRPTSLISEIKNNYQEDFINTFNQGKR